MGPRLRTCSGHAQLRIRNRPVSSRVQKRSARVFATAGFPKRRRDAGLLRPLDRLSRFGFSGASSRHLAAQSRPRRKGSTYPRGRCCASLIAGTAVRCIPNETREASLFGGSLPFARGQRGRNAEGIPRGIETRACGLYSPSVPGYATVAKRLPSMATALGLRRPSTTGKP